MKQQVIKEYKTYIIGSLLALLFLIGSQSTALAQGVSVIAKPDSMLMFIGGQMDFTIEVNQPAGISIKFPVFSDTISKYVEIVEAGNIDTISNVNNQLLLKQVYRITSFDSGVHLIPPVEFEIADATAQKLATQPTAIKVVNPFSNVDPEKGIFDIKQPVNTPFHLSELKPYIWYIVGFLVLVGVIIFLLIWRFNRKLIMPLLGKEKVVEPPHVIALRELERIKSEKLWQKDQTKKYYSQLTETLRQYLEVRFNIRALEQTTDEIIDAISDIDIIDTKNKENLNNLLHLADLVKFAKFQPLIDENDLSMINSVFFVNQTKLEEIKTLEEEKESFKADNAVDESNDNKQITSN